MENMYPPIGVMKTCFTEKFGAPKQSLMIPAAQGILKLKADPAFPLALQHLESFSHIWVLFVFHEHLHLPWHPVIRPPRIDGPRKVGVFASRSPHRPNPIGMSVVKLEKIDLEAKDGIEIHVSGVDLLDGTPILDIKPYLPYADIVTGASEGWAKNDSQKYTVTFSKESLTILQMEKNTGLQILLSQVLERDPRPTSQRKAVPISDPAMTGRLFAFRISDYDVKWEIRDLGIHVLELLEL